MATIEDYKILESIQSAKQKAKNEGKNIPAALSKGKEYNRKAIASVRNAGICMLVTSICTIVILIAISVLALIRASNSGEDTRGILELITNTWPLYIAPIYMIVVGGKLAVLNATPRFIKVNLIIALIISLLYSISITSIVSIVFIIIALTKIRLYRNWFYGIA